MRRVTWLAALGLAAAPAAPALGATGETPPLPDPTALAAGIIEQAGVGAPLPTLPIEQPLTQAVELPAAPAQQAVAEPAETGAEAAPPPQPAAAPTPQPVPEAVPAPAAPTPDAPPPVAVQQEPTNVNVSVRVDSPGDDGAVTQVNVAVGADGGQYQPDSPQYQPVVPAPDAPAPAADPAEAPETESGAGWDWAWSWDCGTAPLASPALPAGVGIENWNWVWNWNCGGDSAPSANNDSETESGYHSAPVQYRPINVNISIRINSPGSNGPVNQTNVAVGVSIPTPPSLPVPVPSPAPVTPAPTAPAPAEPPSAPVAPVEAAAPASPAPESAPEAPAAEHTRACCLLPEPRGVPAPERPASFLAGGSAATAVGISSLPGDAVAVAARLELQVRRAATSAAEPPAPQLRPARPAPSRRDTHEEPTAVTQNGLGIVPVGGPERSLPFAALVLLAFAFASANTSLASVRSRPTHGADADDPPDRPG